MKSRIGWIGLLLAIVAGVLFWLLWFKPAQEARQQAAILKRQLESEQRFAAIAETVESKNGRIVKAHLSRITSERSALCVADATELEEFHVAIMARPDDELAAALRGHTKLRRLSLLGPGISDRSLPIIGELHQLEDLNLESTRITDDGLSHLTGLKNLRSLNLAGTDIRGSGLAHLGKSPALMNVILRDTSVDDDGLAGVASLQNVVILELSQTEIRGAGLKHLARMKKLQVLFLGNVPEPIAHLPQVNTLILDDSGLSPPTLAHLGALKGLKVLRLHSSRIGDDHLAKLSVLPQLTELHFFENQLTAAGLAPLEQCADLQYLSFGRGSLNEESIRRLSEKLPQTRIFWNEGHESKRLGPMP